MKKEKVLFCKIGWMNSYKGINPDDKTIKNGGSYNKNNIGYEIYNFLEVDGTYYGFVQAPSDSIEVNKLQDSPTAKKLDYADNVLVVFVATNTKGPVIIGWYKNARVFRNLNKAPESVMATRELKDHYLYNITSNKGTILPLEKRNFKITGFGRADIWYGNETVNEEVIKYINNIEMELTEYVENIEQATKNLIGSDKEVIAKARLNQGLFRNILLHKYQKCCLCQISNPELLIASHIKPWTVSTGSEKLDENNGLLLCANHDRLFDKGLITFDSNGKILISKKIDSVNRIFSNIKEDMTLNVSNEMEYYMKYHRENIFKSE